ncbi:hypothetical protein FALBO_923 [Fusarium albosuccineum]|uniref:Uncharacterized protein n=1 Tax=Fusarium albosuccineum TaxID=1237068 RepID=A0A8H4LQW6_9HYPO|nr:hypothetical protein FALBO_923 [Fusarium albosuccineum]
MHLRSPDRVTFHHLASQSWQKKRRRVELDQQELKLAKRRRHEPGSARSSSSDDDHDNVSSLVDGYVVDLGLVKAFPSKPDAECLPEPRHDTDQEGRAGTTTESHIPQLRVMRTSATIVIVIIIVAGLVIVFPVTLTTALLPPRPPSRQVSLQPVDWFQQAIWDGPVDRVSGRAITPCTHPSKSPNPRPGVRSEWWLPDSPFYPRYKPWNSTPDGIYVPESYFVHDVGTALDSVFADLETIADHWPPLFRFQRENSTQFRWSTSADTYMPPNDTLPTLSLDLDEILKLASASTVLGLPPSAGCWWWPLSKPYSPLREQLGAALGKLGSDNSDRNDEVASFWPAIINDQALMMLFKLADFGGRVMEPDHDRASDTDIPLDFTEAVCKTQEERITVLTQRIKANGTAIELLKILNMTVDQRFEGDGDKGAPKVDDLFNYRDVVQVLGPGYQGMTASHPDAQWAHAKTQEALSRLHDITPFINQLAVGRL